MVILLAAGFMSLGLLNLELGRDWWRGQLVRFAIGLPIVLIYAYAEMPPLVFPQALTLLLLTLVPNAVYSLLSAARAYVASRRIVSIRRTKMWPYVGALAAVGAFAGILAVAPIVDASGLRDVAAVTVSRSSASSAPTTASATSTCRSNAAASSGLRRSSSKAPCSGSSGARARA